MTFFQRALALALVLCMPSAFAWSNHSVLSYRALEQMPEVANAPPVIVESLETFLKSEEKTLEALLASQEAWALANLEKFPVRPAALAFIANADRSDDARRLAFLMALRVAPNSKFALYVQPDPRAELIHGNRLAFSSVNTLPEPQNSGYVFTGLRVGDTVSPLAVVASASDEPDYGLDINLWDDSPSDWGKVYGFGTLPFGNPALNYATQAPFHMGFFHEDRILYLAAPFIKRTFPLLRSYQYSSLAALAFRTGHAYWGWRFTGLALHYVQDLAQPYHASLAPGNSTIKLLSANLLAMAGMTMKKNDLVVLLSNQHLVLEKYQKELLQSNAGTKLDTLVEKSLRNPDKDRIYPEWSDDYLRNVVTAQSAAYGPKLVKILLAAVPEVFVSDPSFDFGVKEDGINLIGEMAKRDAGSRAALDGAVTELLSNFGAHSRNAVRGVLRAGFQQ